MTQLNEQTPIETPIETPTEAPADPTAENMAFLQRFAEENRPQQGEPVDIQAIMAEEVAKLQMAQMQEQAVKEMQAANPHMTEAQATNVIDAIRQGDFARVMQITETAAKRKAEMEQSQRDAELQATETEGASKGEQLPEGKPKNQREGKRRALARMRGQ